MFGRPLLAALGGALVAASALVGSSIGCHQIVGIEPLESPLDSGGGGSGDGGSSAPDGGASPSNARVRVTSACSDFTFHTEATQSAPRLVIVAQYGVDPGDTTIVKVTATTPIVLALSSYVATHWKVEVAPEARVERLVLHGHDAPQEVEGLDVTTDRIVGSSTYVGAGYRWPDDEAGDSAVQLASALEAKTSSRLAAHGGCYENGTFEVVDE